MSNRASALRALAAVLGAADGGRVDVPELPGGAAWDPVLALAGAGGLMPALWSATQRLGLLEPVPDELLERLAESPAHRHAAAVLQLSHRLNGARNADLVVQLDEASSLLDRAGIPVVALKGIGHLVRGVWPDPADRVMVDLDLLVPTDSAADAQERLIAAGYELVPDHERAPDRHHLNPLRRPDRPGSIEVHVEPLSRGYGRALRASEVFAAARAVPGHPTVLVPSPTHTAVIALAHAYLADRSWRERTVPLKGVHELWRFEAKEPIEWPEVRGLLGRIGHGQLVAEHQVSVFCLLGGRRPPASVATARARARLAVAETNLRQVLAPADKVAGAIDAGRLRGYYGTDIGGPWRLRAHHLRHVVRRALMLVLLVLAACGHTARPQAAIATTTSAPSTTTPTTTTTTAPPEPSTAAPVANAPPATDLAGTVFVLDPGHNEGNSRHASEINREVDVGNGSKACDTTGTATDSGYSEARFTTDVADRVATILRAAGATVVLTRDASTAWGPCIDERAAIGNEAHADAVISIHADGGPPDGHGFHVIEPLLVAGHNDGIIEPSKQLGLAVRDAFRSETGLPFSTYLGHDGIDARNDLGGLNLSTVPKVFIETGNMRNADDAALLEDATFRQKIAAGIADGLLRFASAT
jgi:N-acetylmuramoyl-L-alanine amidase